MTDSTNPTPPSPRRRTIVFRVAVTLACAVVLTGGFVYGAFATCNFMSGSPSKAFGFFLWASVAGVAVVLLSILFLLV